MTPAELALLRAADEIVDEEEREAARERTARHRAHMQPALEARRRKIVAERPSVPRGHAAVYTGRGLGGLEAAEVMGMVQSGYSTGEIAEAAMVNTSSVRRWCADNNLRFVSIQVWVPKDAVPLQESGL